jgi:hypothetical protein
MAFSSQRLPLPIPENGTPFARVDLRFLDVAHDSESFEGRIFFNEPDASLRTPTDVSAGYAGSLYVFGHPHCWGDDGHCALPPGPLHGHDDRTPHHLVPQLHVVRVTKSVERLIETGAKTVVITVLPIVRKNARRRVSPELLRFSRLELVSYD